jgi:hypothetical protein
MQPATAIAVAFLVVLVLLVIVFVIVRARSTAIQKYDVPIIDVMNQKVFENKSPPPIVSNFHRIPYELTVNAYDFNTGMGIATIAYLEDIGLSEGAAIFSANFRVSNNGYRLTLSDFQYSQIVGKYASNMPEGPWTFNFTNVNPTTIQLTGHYDNITEVLTPA